MNKIFVFKGVNVRSTSVGDIFRIFFYRIISLLIIAVVVVLAIIGLQVGTVAILFTGTAISLALTTLSVTIFNDENASGKIISVIVVVMTLYSFFGRDRRGRGK